MEPPATMYATQIPGERPTVVAIGLPVPLAPIPEPWWLDVIEGCRSEPSIADPTVQRLVLVLTDRACGEPIERVNVDGRRRLEVPTAEYVAVWTWAVDGHLQEWGIRTPTLEAYERASIRPEVERALLYLPSSAFRHFNNLRES